MTRLRRASPWLLAAALVLAGANHAWHPAAYEPLVPGWLGSARAWVLLSGLAEVVVGLLVAAPRTRRAGALATAVLLVAVFPGNLTAFVNADGAGQTWLTALRLPLHLPLLLWAWSVAGQARPLSRPEPAARRSG